MIKSLLTTARDARWVWDLMGPIYNRQIYKTISRLYEDIARDDIFAASSRVLDVGTGPGCLSLMLATRYPGASYTGIDYSSLQVRAAEHLRQKKAIRNCVYRQGNAMHIPFAEGCFDAAFSVGSIKHWPDPECGLAEIRRVLAPGRWVIIAETDKDASVKEIEAFAERFTAWFLWDPLLRWGLRHIIFGRSVSQRDVARLAQKVGFRNIRTARHTLCPYLIVWAQK